MHDEDGFLSTIRHTPADDVARLVFADWLDEQDDATCKLKADFIRLEMRIANELQADSSSLAVQLQKLAAQLDRDWLAVISRPKIEGCVTWVERECPSIWSQLTPTRDPNARTCEACQKTVRYAQTFEEVRDYAWRGYCTAISPALTNHPTIANQFLRPLAVIGLEHEPLIERPRLSSSLEERCPDRQELSELLNRAAEEPEGDAATPDRPNVCQSVRREKGRGRFRNLQRESWEELE